MVIPLEFFWIISFINVMFLIQKHTHTHTTRTESSITKIHIGLRTICLILKRTVFSFFFPLKEKLERLHKINRLTKDNLKHLSCISLCCRILLSKSSSIFSESLLLFHPHQDLNQTINHHKWRQIIKTTERERRIIMKETWSIAVSCSCLSARACWSSAASCSNCSTYTAMQFLKQIVFSAMSILK